MGVGRPQRGPRASAGSLVDGGGGLLQQGRGLHLFRGGAGWVSEAAPLQLQKKGVAPELASLFHTGRGSVPLTPDTQSSAQGRALGRHATDAPCGAEAEGTGGPGVSLLDSLLAPPCPKCLTFGQVTPEFI